MWSAVPVIIPAASAPTTSYWQNLRAQRQQPVEQPVTTTKPDNRKELLGARKGEPILPKLFGWGISLIIILGVLYWLTPEKEKLAIEYNVPEEKVLIEPEPHGCDYDDAPLGNKHCHFEKVVDTEKACADPDCRVTSVYESWQKVKE
jgi:hypothetical protein